MSGSSSTYSSSSWELERYDRQVRVSGWNQELLQRTTVFIVGVGALGCEVAKNLALMGVGGLVLVDNDVVELSNLSRQMLFRDGDIGRSKSRVAGERLKEMNKHVNIEVLEGDVRRIPQKYFEESDIICSCVDNWPTRRWVNSISVELNKPLVDVAMEGVYANVQDIIPGKTACIECHADVLIPREVQEAECTLRRRKPEDLINDLKENGIEISYEEALEFFKAGIKTVYDIKYSPLGSLASLSRKAEETIQSIREALRPKMPALQDVAATISGIATMEIIKIIHQGRLGKVFSGLILYDAIASRVTRVRLERNSECFVCGDYLREEGAEITVSGDITVLQLKELIASRYMYPDVEILYGVKRLKDGMKLQETGIKTGDIIYIHTSRRASPLKLRVRISESGG